MNSTLVDKAVILEGGGGWGRVRFLMRKRSLTHGMHNSSKVWRSSSAFPDVWPEKGWHFDSFDSALHRGF